MSPSTVKTHIGKIYEKLGAHNRASAVIAAVRLGLISDNPGRTASAGPEFLAVRSDGRQITRKSSTMRIAPGPMMMMNSAGKMQSSSGNRILTVTF